MAHDGSPVVDLMRMASRHQRLLDDVCVGLVACLDVVLVVGRSERDVCVTDSHNRFADMAELSVSFDKEIRHAIRSIEADHKELRRNQY